MNTQTLKQLWEEVGYRVEEQVSERPDERLGLCTLTKEVCRLSNMNERTYNRNVKVMLTQLNAYRPEGKNEIVYWWPRDDEDYLYRMMICQQIIDSL